MNRTQEVKVGLFVVAAAALLVTALVVVGGLNLFQQPTHSYTLRVKFAGGVDAGSPVRYAGIKVGRVEGTELDPDDPTRVRVLINVDAETPVRTDSVARVSALGMLGENYVEISPGSPEAPPLPPGSEIAVSEAARWDDLVESISGATSELEGLLNDARPRVNQTLDNISDLTDQETRRRVQHLLRQIDGLVTESRPKVQAILTKVDSATAKVDQFMTDLRGTREKVDQLLVNWRDLAQGDDAEVQKTLRSLRETLARAEQSMDEIRRLLVANRQNLDVTLENFRVSSENIREFTDVIKQRPYSLVRVKNPPDRKPGDPQ